MYAGAMDSQAKPAEPKYLYKYQPFNEVFARDLLLDNKLWFASPLDFNDPFDCRPVIDLCGSPQELLFWSARHYQKRTIGVPVSVLLEKGRELAQQFQPEVEDEEANRGARDALNEMLRDLGVLSLAARDNDVLMWSHYAANHTGVCWRFDHGVEFFAQAAEVKYAENRPVFRVLEGDRGDLADRMLLTKADFWKHEGEWRIVQPGVAGLISFPADGLTGVVLGSAITAADEARLRSLIAERSDQIEVLRANIDPKLYRVTIEVT